MILNGSKTYWSILTRFLNKKITITPLSLFDGKLMSDFKEKVDFFNSHFAAQCTVVNNTSALPEL